MKVLGSGNANMYADPKLHLDSIRAATDVFQHKSLVESNAEHGQETASRLQRLEVIHLEDSAKWKMEQQQLHVDRLNDQENLGRPYLMFENASKSACPQKRVWRRPCEQIFMNQITGCIGMRDILKVQQHSN